MHDASTLGVEVGPVGGIALTFKRWRILLFSLLLFVEGLTLRLDPGLAASGEPIPLESMEKWNELSN